MIRNLKIKFVAITMILVSIIIASVFSIILKTNSKAMESQSIDDLKEIISMSLIDLVKATAYTNGSDMKKLQYTSLLSSWALKPVEIAWLQQKQFIADASHELKTPLTVLLANMDILEENENDTIKNQIKWINSSKQEAMQMKTLLEEMLFLAKTDKSKREITFEKINVSDILISQILSLEVIAFEKNIDINYENVQEDLYINANEKQIQFEINNFGPIIPKTELTHIFERFYRVEKSRNKEHGGYGLGLSIAKKITDNHNMKIWAESNEQKGTSFKIIMNGTNQN